MQKPQTFIFIGRSGAGKGTQIELLMNKIKERNTLPILYVKQGDNFRKFWQGESYTSKRANELAITGELQPSFLTVWIWADILVKNVTGNENLVFDGTPRRMSEAKILESALKFYGIVDPIVIFINVSKEWAVERLKGRGRSDDGDNSIEKRMQWFDRDVNDTIGYVRANPYYKFIPINGEQTVEQVHKEICQKIGL